MSELLLEILSEEVPARMQMRAAEDLRAEIVRGLQDEHLVFDSAEAFASPRRLSLVVRGLPERQPDRLVEKRGPREGAPKGAVEGFARSVGCAVTELKIEETKKGRYYIFSGFVQGTPAPTVCANVIGRGLRCMAWPKSMRWGAGSFRWVRPIASLMAILDGQPLPLAIDTGGGTTLLAGAATVGHRFLRPGPLSVSGFEDYCEKLRVAKVLLKTKDRESVIWGGASKLAKEVGLRLRTDTTLLNEVAGLVEWPVPLMGAIDAEFLDLPSEVLVTTMRSHQKYFATEAEDGRLGDRFIVVANIEGKDGGKAIIAGNERVLRARLSDAKFFWDQDRKMNLIERVPALKQITFFEKLGTLDKKIDRTQALAAGLVDWVPDANRDLVHSAVQLAKADLTTAMVGEYPELQGVMGHYYALADGQHPAVAKAIAEHYAPQGPHDTCPSAPISVIVALADKIDNLTQFWSVGEKPTGSKDPFALRRATLGVIRLVLENRLRIPLMSAFALSGITVEEATDLLSFFAERLKVHLRNEGVRHDLIAAVFSLTGEDDLVRLLARVEALSAFLDSPEGEDLLTAYRRAANIVRIEEKKDGVKYDGAWEPGLSDQMEEDALAASLQEAREHLIGFLREEDFGSAMRTLATLRGPVDGFFDRVTVNVDASALRANRLRLLSQITDTLQLTADFSEIEG